MVHDSFDHLCSDIETFKLCMIITIKHINELGHRVNKNMLA